MPQYFLEMGHTEQECLQALDYMVTYSTQLMGHTWYACMAGVHRGWATVEAENEAEARRVLPPSMRNLATIHEVRRFTPDDVRSLHQK